MAYVEEMNDNKILCILKEFKHVNNFDNDITLNGYISYISKKDVFQIIFYIFAKWVGIYSDFTFNFNFTHFSYVKELSYICEHHHSLTFLRK